MAFIKAKTNEEEVARHTAAQAARLRTAYADLYEYMMNYSWVVIRDRTIRQGGHVDHQERLTVYRYDVVDDKETLTMAVRAKEDMIADTLTLAWESLQNSEIGGLSDDELEAEIKAKVRMQARAVAGGRTATQCEGPQQRFGASLPIGVSEDTPDKNCRTVATMGRALGMPVVVANSEQEFTDHEKERKAISDMLAELGLTPKQTAMMGCRIAGMLNVDIAHAMAVRETTVASTMTAAKERATPRIMEYHLRAAQRAVQGTQRERSDSWDNSLARRAR